MASESAFNKRLTGETNLDKVEGLLEHLNLPPKVIDLIRANHKLLMVVLIALVVGVVVWALYDSYRENKVDQASSALAVALQDKGDSRATKLEEVSRKFSSTPSALWAKVELAHLDMQKGAFGDAATKYQAILSDVSSSDPVYPLIVYGLAQSFEGGKKYPEAMAQYDLLKNIKGFEQVGYLGMGRLEEAQGNFDKAIAIYNDFLLTLGEGSSAGQIRTEIASKIAWLKARK